MNQARPPTVCALLRAVLLSLVCALGLSAQNAFDLARPSLRVHGMEDGLPSSTIYGFARDTKGRLWVGTPDGAAYYTGHGWVAVRLPRESPSQYVRSLLASRDGSLWFATQDGGLWRLENDRWTHFRGGRELPSDHVFSIAESQGPRGQMVRWVGTDRGIAALTGDQWRIWGPAEGVPVGTVWRIREIQAPDGSHPVWAATEKGLCVLGGDRWRILDAQDGFRGGDANDILDVREADGTRCVWVSLWTKGLARWDSRGWTYYASGKDFPASFPTSSLCATRDPAGRPIIWIGTLNQGLWWFREGRWQSLGRSQGFMTVGVLSLYPVPEGKPTLLVGTRGGGVASLDLGGWRTLDASLGLPGLEVTCFSETLGRFDAGAFWVGTTAGLACYRPGRPPEHVDARVFSSSYIICLLATEDALWVGTLNGLVWRDAQGWHRVKGDLVSPNGLIISLLETRSSHGVRSLWVGTPRGLYRRREGRWRRYTSQDGLPQDYASALCSVSAPNGDPMLWVGTRGGGVSCLQGETWVHLGANAGISNGNIYALHVSEGPDGHRWLWAGTLGGGLARLDLRAPTRWEAFTRETLPELSSNYIQRIEEDRQGRLYLSTSAGVVRLRLDWTSGAPRPSGIETFTLGDGLPSRDGNLGASYVDSQGRIWIGTSQGAAALDPSVETFPPAPPLPVLERVTIADPERVLLPGQRLGYRDNHLRFTFSLPVLHRKEDTHYQTQLAGLEKEPRPWHRESWREFATLPAGHYVMRIWARTYEGRISGPVEFPFEIAPAPWKQPVAYLVYLLAAGVASWGILRLRTRVLRERTVALEAAVAQRTRIIEQQSQALESSNQALQGRNQELSSALSEVKTLRGLIPICAYCKKIRDDQGFWEQMEHYISDHSDAQFSHGICPDCRDQHFPARIPKTSPPSEPD